MPSTDTCMSCHKQIWADSPYLEPVRASFRTGKPIEWIRVHDLPDYAYFNHSIHVNKGVGCSTCHGRVDEMPIAYQASTLQMEWCLECHRDAGKICAAEDRDFRHGHGGRRTRPREEIDERSIDLKAEYKIQKPRGFDELFDLSPLDG